MKRRFAILIISLLLFNLSITAVAMDNQSSSITEGVYSLKGAENTLSNDDLIAIKSTLKDKEIIAVGESTHGTSEFFKMKHRFFKFLVEELGFRALAIEQGMAETERINKYINGKDDNPKELLNNAYVNNNTQEMLDFIEWARDYNLSCKDNEKVRFYGMDIQDRSAAILNIRDYYKYIKSSTFDDLNKNYNENTNFYESIKKDLIDNSERYIKESSLEEYNLNLRLIENKILSLNFVPNNTIRNDNMANNIIWIKDYEKEYYNNDKIMIWAHDAYTSFNKSQNFLGAKLKEKYGDKYYGIAQQFYSGSFVAGHNDGYKKYNISESNKDNINSKIYEEFPYNSVLFIDIKSGMNNNKLNSILDESSSITEFGVDQAKNIDTAIFKLDIKECYDGIIYFKSTNCANYFNQPPDTKVIELKANNTIFSYIKYLIGTLIIILLFYLYDRRKNLKTQNDENNKGKLGGIITLLACSNIATDIFFLINTIVFSFISSFNIYIISDLVSRILGIVGFSGVLKKKRYGVILVFIRLITLAISFESLSAAYLVSLLALIQGYIFYRKRHVFSK